MQRIPVVRYFVLATLIAVPAVLRGQDTTKVKPDSMKPGMMMESHMMGPWKEMNAFHQVMAATWHPASQKSDLAPLKSRAKELATAAETWSKSIAPTMPPSCGSDAVRTAVGKVVTESKALVALVDSGADDTRLKAALKGVHDSFEVAEKACAGHGAHK